jgi:nucleotide sugar dehydrogenase
MSAKILILGSGVVGEATGTVLAEHGFDITFADVNEDVVGRLRDKGHKALLVKDVARPDVDIYMVSVPTYPLDICKDSATAAKLEQTMSPLEWCDIGIDFAKSAADTLGQWLADARRYQVVTMRSAVLPGTMAELLIPIMEKRSGKKAGKDFGVCVNPEYLRERVSVEDIRKPWVTVVGGLDKRSGDAVAALYEWADCPLYRVSIKEAEMQKFIHNLCNAAKISFFNEMRLVSERIGVDAEKIIPIVAKSAEALWNPEYGTKNYGPFGGKCLPKDTLAFLMWAKRSGMETRLMEGVLEVNQVFEKRLQSALR